MHGFIDLVLLYLGVVSNVHSIFVHHSSTSTIVLIVYVDDIIISKSEKKNILLSSKVTPLVLLI